MANEYIIFDKRLCDRFVPFVAERGIAADVKADAMEGFVVALPDTLDETLEATIDTEYDAIMDEQRELTESADDDRARTLMAVTITLPDGAPCVVPIGARLGRRLYNHFTIEEVQDLVAEIAAAVTNPVARPLCRR